MSLDTASLRNAVQRLREGLARHQAEPNDEQLRDGLIQRFEFISRRISPGRAFCSPARGRTS